jgi:hypothetical protein
MRSCRILQRILISSMCQLMPCLRAGSYGFEYSDESMSEGAVDIENQYYNSKGAFHSPSMSIRQLPSTSKSPHKAAGNVESNSLEEALNGFQEVLKMEGEKGEW